MKQIIVLCFLLISCGTERIEVVKEQKKEKPTYDSGTNDPIMKEMRAVSSDAEMIDYEISKLDKFSLEEKKEDPYKNMDPNLLKLIRLKKALQDRMKERKLNNFKNEHNDSIDEKGISLLDEYYKMKDSYTILQQTISSQKRTIQRLNIENKTLRNTIKSLR